MSSKVTQFLYDWKLKLAILSAILIPTASAVGSFYKLEIRLNEKNAETEQRISKVELEVARNFADKSTMEQLRKDVSDMRNDITEIKTLLKLRRHAR